MQEIEFWFSIGSTYTYLTVLRMDQIQRDHGIELKLRPFSVRNIMRQMDNVPFPPSKKSKVDYMWRDIERRSIRYGFPAKVPAPYPLKEFDLANKLAILGVQEGWCAEYLKKTYVAWFQNGQEAGSNPNVTETLVSIGLDPNETLEKIERSAIQDQYEKQTEIAKNKGIFGSPSFIVGDEIFWGDDRLENAIEWSSGMIEA